MRLNTNRRHDIFWRVQSTQAPKEQYIARIDATNNPLWRYPKPNTDGGSSFAKTFLSRALFRVTPGWTRPYIIHVVTYDPDIHINDDKASGLAAKDALRAHQGWCPKRTVEEIKTQAWQSIAPILKHKNPLHVPPSAPKRFPWVAWSFKCSPDQTAAYGNFSKCFNHRVSSFLQS